MMLQWLCLVFALALGCHRAPDSLLSNEPGQNCIHYDALKIFIPDLMPPERIDPRWFPRRDRAWIEAEIESFRYVALREKDHLVLKQVLTRSHPSDLLYLDPLRFSESYELPLFDEPIYLVRNLDLFELSQLGPELLDVKPVAYFYKNLAFVPKSPQKLQPALLDQAQNEITPPFHYNEHLAREDLVLFPVLEEKDELARIMMIDDRPYVALGQDHALDVLGNVISPRDRSVTVAIEDFARLFDLHLDLKRSALLQEGIHFLPKPLHASSEGRRLSMEETLYAITHDLSFSAVDMFSPILKQDKPFYLEFWEGPLQGYSLVSPESGSFRLRSQSFQDNGRDQTLITIGLTTRESQVEGDLFTQASPKRGELFRYVFEGEGEVYMGYGRGEHENEALSPIQLGKAEFLVHRRHLHSDAYRYTIEIRTMRGQ